MSCFINGHSAQVLAVQFYEVERAGSIGRGAVPSIYAATCAAAFRFLLQPSKLIAPRPAAKSEKAAGSRAAVRYTQRYVSNRW